MSAVVELHGLGVHLGRRQILHELNASLSGHAIGLLGDLAKDAVDSPEELIETVDEIRAVTERTGAAARYCADMVSADIHSSMPADMRRAARRVMADIKYTFTVEGEDALKALKPRTRADLFLFFKDFILHLDIRQCGLGGASCGPGTLPQYLVQPGTYEFAVRLRPFAADQ